MGLLQIKKDYEQYLLDNYIETPVHWSGMKFDITANNEWIYFEYVGQSIEACGIDDVESIHNGILTLTVVAETRFRVMEIADIVLLLFKGVRLGDTSVHSVSIFESGMLDVIDKSYMEFNIEIKMV